MTRARRSTHRLPQQATRTNPVTCDGQRVVPKQAKPRGDDCLEPTTSDTADGLPAPDVFVTIRARLRATLPWTSPSLSIDPPCSLVPGRRPFYRLPRAGYQRRRACSPSRFYPWLRRRLCKRGVPYSLHPGDSRKAFSEAPRMIPGEETNGRVYAFAEAGATRESQTTRPAESCRPGCSRENVACDRPSGAAAVTEERPSPGSDYPART